jgi:hypothetical protein
VQDPTALRGKVRTTQGDRCLQVVRGLHLPPALFQF